MTERRAVVHAATFAVAVAAVVASCGAAAAPAAAVRPALIAVLERAGDERLDDRRVQQAYPGHPGGPAQQAVAVALKESAVALEAAGIAVRVEAVAVASAAEAGAAADKLVRAGAVAFIADLPPQALLAAASAAASRPVINTGEAADALREGECRPNLFHALPSERMRADALAQHLAARRWQRVLLLHAADEPARVAAAHASLRRHGLTVVAQRVFKRSADPREREHANPLLLTGGADHDVVWVVDGDGEFARGLPYRTALPRPVVGDAGLTALAWSPRFERYGAPQLARRFERHAGRPMTGHDWAAWIAAKAVVQALLDARGATAATLGPALVVDGFKGVRLSFRAWDRQLRQPMLLGDGLSVVATAPQDGFLHATNALDTLGADAPERRCTAAP